MLRTNNYEKCQNTAIRTISKSALYKLISLNITIVGKEAFVTLKLNNAKRPITCLLDGGSHISLISIDTMKHDAPLNKQNILLVTSATGHSTRTFATLNDFFSVDKMQLEHEFHIYDNSNLPITADGLLGMDFFLKYFCITNLLTLELTLHVPIQTAEPHNNAMDTHTSLHIANEIPPENDIENNACFDIIEKHNPNKNTNKPNSKCFAFPNTMFQRKIFALSSAETKIESYARNLIKNENKRIAIIPECCILNFEIQVDLADGDYNLEECNILPNVNLYNSVVRVKNKSTFIAIINYNNFPVQLSTSDISHLKFNHVNLFKVLIINEARSGFINNKIKLGHCDTHSKSVIIKLCQEFSDCFFVDGDTVKHTDLMTHTIHLKPDAKPAFTKQYKLPEAQKQEIHSQLQKMEREGIVEKCKASGWNSPIILVPKRDENGLKTKYRLVVDFRKLNEATIPFQFPIPQIDCIIDRLSNSKYFSTLDLYGAFYQIKLTEESKKYTTFENNNFSYRFISMPQGLNTSPATMQNAVNLLFSDYLNKGINIYLDDIIVYSATFEEHIFLLKEIFSKLRKHNFKLKVEKSKFLMRKIEYLGFIIDEHGYLPNTIKVDCINKYPTPTNVTELQRYLGMCNYYRKFIRNYAQIAKPLYNLLRKEVTFVWNSACTESFNILKQSLSNPPVLIFPNFKHTFIVTTDASSIAVGGVLSQGDLPNDRPIQFISKVLNKTQQNYSTIERELYAIVFAVDSFRHYIYGFEFIIYTDHRPLVYLFNLKNPSSKLFRWRLLLSEYRFKIVYKQGSQNVVADALSRINYAPIELNKLTKDSEIVKAMAITRSKARATENIALNESSTDITNRKKSHNFFEINENNDILTNCDAANHIFYFFSSINCDMKRKLEYRMKSNIELPENPTPFIPYNMNNKQTIFLVPNEKRTDKRVMNTKLILSSILQTCIDNNYNDIAINIDIREASIYFEFKYLFKEIFKQSDIKVVFYLNKVIDVVDLDHILEILSTYHNSSLAGHTSFEKTKNSIRRYYRWPTMNTDIKKFVQNCEICKKSKITRHTKSPMQITSTSDYPFQKVYIDFVNVERTHSNLYPCIFTCIDELTKFGIAVRAKNCSALLAAHKFVKHVILKYNIPKSVVSDLGSAFTADIFKEITKLFKIKKISTTPYRPNANIVERFHKTLAQHLITCVHENPTSWHEHLDSAVFAYNNTINSATGYSPHELLFGYKIQLPDKIIKNIDPIYNYDSYKEDLRFNLAKFWKIAKQNINERKQKNKEYRDVKSNALSLKIGDRVLFKKPFKTHKYATPYDGPFSVEEIISPVTVKIKKGHKLIKIHTDKLKLA